jgi:hypothetical protein
VGWGVLARALVRSVVIEMVHVLFKDTPGVSFVVDQHPIGALGAYAANKPFCIAVRSGYSGRDLDHVDALGAEDCIEGISELGIPIADEEAERGGLVAQVYQQGAGGLGVQAVVGCVVTPRRWTRRVRTSLTNRM